MRNAIIAAIVAAIISVSGGFAAGVGTSEYRQDRQIEQLQAKAECLNRASFNLVHECLYYHKIQP